MNALGFLVRKQIKNFFRDLVHHPGRLTAYILMAALLVMTIFAGVEGSAEKGNHFSDIRILHGIFLAWLLFLGIVTLLASLKSGTTMFKMSDVNFLFVSPIDPKTIMTYGLAKQTAMSLYGFIFMLFYSGMLMQNFHVNVGGVVGLIVYSVALLLVIQLISLILYNYSNGDAARKNRVRAFIYAYLGLMLITALYVFRKNGGGVEAGLAALSSPYIEYFPIIGWTKGAAFGLLTGNMTAMVIYTALLAASFVGLLVLFRKSDTDYYEDVLQTTETQFQMRQSMKDRRNTTTMMRADKKIRVGKTGLGGGWGANTFFYKHLCETRRRNRFAFLSTSSIITLAANLIVVAVIASIRSSEGKAAIQPDNALMTAFWLDIYLLFLMNAMGDWARELQKPYIYLVPADPFKKLLWASMTSVLKPVVDGAIFFFITAAVVHASPFSALAAFLTYSSFGLLFLAGNILSQRTMGSMSNRGLMMLLFMLVLFLLMGPGIAGSIILGVKAQGAFGAAYYLICSLPMVGWNILVSLVIIYLCRNLLSNLEVSN